MSKAPITPRELWSRQHIGHSDVDYASWHLTREAIAGFSRMSGSCIFTVDVYQERYDFASSQFSRLFGYKESWLKSIQKQGDMLEDRIHPDDRKQILEFQIEHGEFIYSLSPEQRNDYQQIFQFRMLNSRQRYVHVVSRQQVIQKDKYGKAWIILGILDISPNQQQTGKVKRSVVNHKTGEIITSPPPALSSPLTLREKEILSLVGQGLLTKEIAGILNISIHTVNRHRKSILSKSGANNAIEALNRLGNAEF